MWQSVGRNGGLKRADGCGQMGTLAPPRVCVCYQDVGFTKCVLSDQDGFELAGECENVSYAKRP